MKKINIIYPIIFLALIIGVGVDFYYSLKEDYFFRFKYDLRETKILTDTTKVFVDSLSYNTISFSESIQLEPSQTYQLSYNNDPDKKFVFAFSNQTDKSQKAIKNLVWYFTEPLQKKGKALIEKIKLSKKINSNKTIKVAMLTDQLGCCIMFGKKMRYLWNEKNHDLDFLGNKKDVYNYSYYGDKYLTSYKAVEISKNLAKADLYLIWMSVNEKNTEEYVKNLNIILSNVKEKFPSAKVILLTAPPSPVTEINQRIIEVNNLISKKGIQGIKVINTTNLFFSNKNWAKDFYKYDYALSEKAYKMIVNTLNNEI